MAQEKFEPATKTTDDKDVSVKPDAETLNTTDPQEHMKGPLSSFMHKIEDGMESETPKKDDDDEDDK